jgi:hypothetical protein
MMMMPLSDARTALVRQMLMQTELGSEKKEPRKRLYPDWRILQGVFIIGIGIVFLVLNWGSPYKEITGKILGTTDINTSAYIRFSTDPNDLYDTTGLYPGWTGQFIQNARVDAYYDSNDLQKHIVALQMYDLSGRPTVKYTTTEYTNSLNPSPFSNIGRDIGVAVILLGLLWASRGVFLLVRTGRQLA